MTCRNRTILDDWHDLLEGKVSKTQRTAVTWHQYTGKSEELPELFFSVLIFKPGYGMFAGYIPKGPKEPGLWAAYNPVEGAHPIESGDWWAEYPDPPEVSE